MALVRDAAYRFDERGHNVLPLADGTLVYRHAALGLSSGRVRPLQTGDRFVGFAGRRVDSRWLAVGAPPVDVPIIASGTIELPISGVAATDVGATVYATDDNTFGLIGLVAIGTISGIASAGVARVAFNALGPSSVSGDGIWFSPGDTPNTTDARLAAAVIAAGTGGTINLYAGQTYTTRRGWRLGAGQRLNMNGAVIQRAAQDTTTTTATLTSGSTSSFAVADASAFRAGDLIIVQQGLRYSAPATIQGISGNTITITGTLQVGAASAATVALATYGPYDASWTLTGTTNVVLVYSTLDATAAAAVVGGTVDGNRTNNTLANKWDVLQEINCLQTRIADVEVRNFPGEGIQQIAVPAATYKATATEIGTARVCAITRCRIYNGSGNGIHLSGVDQTVIDGNWAWDLNQLPECGHIGGFITFSFGGLNTKIVNNHAMRCFSFAGPIQIDTGSQLTITGNGADSMHRYALWGSAGNPYNQTDVRIVGNSWQFCGIMQLSAQVASFARRFIAADNTSLGTQWIVQRVNNAVMHDNALESSLHHYIPTTISGAITANSTQSVTVASATGLYVGQRVRAARQGVITGVVVIASVSGTTIGFTAPFDTSLGAGATLYDAEAQRCGIATTYCTTGQSTVTLADASQFRVNEWIVVYNTTADNATAAARISAIDYTTGVVTIDGTWDRTHSSGSSYAYHGWSPWSTSHVVVNACNAQVHHNNVAGGYSGINTQGDCTGANIERNTLTRQFRYPILTSSTSGSAEQIVGNIITAASGVTSTSAYLLWLRGSARARNNVITASSTVGHGIYADSVNSIIDGNEIKLSAGSGITMSASSSGTRVRNTYSNRTITDNGTGNTVDAVLTIT